MSDFQNHKDIKRTRKDHRCYLCFLIIPKGSACSYSSGVYEGDFYSHYDHHECMKLWMDINDGVWCEDWMMLEEMDEFDEHQQTIREKYGLRQALETIHNMGGEGEV